MKTVPTVLLANADDSTREFSALVLARTGVRVEQAQSGEQAFAKADQLLPDAVVAHLRLPGLDGAELHQRLRSHPRTRTIPILVVSGSADTWLDAVDIVSRVVRWREIAEANVEAAPDAVTFN